MGADPLPEETHVLGGLDELLRERQAAARQILHDLTKSLGEPPGSGEDEPPPH